jgi:hypothetical protein
MTNVPDGPLGEAGARLLALVAIRDRVKSIQGCASRACNICDGQLFAVLQDLDAMLSAPVVSGWQPIETLASFDELVLMWTPVERLYSSPYLETMHPEVRASTRRHWTWATHWMPLPAAPVVTQEGE